MSGAKFNIRDLDPNNPGSWPAAARLVACVMAGAAVVAIAWYALIGGQREELGKLERQEVQLRKDYNDVAAKANNLEPLKTQLTELESQLQTVLRQLPSKTEMPDLIVDISQTAQGSGITTELFQPEAEVVKEFYAEKPISVRMLGSYHQFGAFVSGVADLPRMVIMTMQDITLKPREGEKSISAAGTGSLELVSTIKTYRYLDDEETEEQEALAIERERAEKAKAAKAKKSAPKEATP